MQQNIHNCRRWSRWVEPPESQSSHSYSVLFHPAYSCPTTNIQYLQNLGTFLLGHLIFPQFEEIV